MKLDFGKFGAGLGWVGLGWVFKGLDWEGNAALVGLLRLESNFLKLGFFDKKLNRVKIVSESNFLRNFDQNLICGDSTAAAKIAYLYI